MSSELNELKTKMASAMASRELADDANDRLKRIRLLNDVREQSEVQLNVSVGRSSVDDWLISVIAQKGSVFVDASYIVKGSYTHHVDSAEQAITESSDMLGRQIAEAFIKCSHPDDYADDHTVTRSYLRANLTVHTDLWDGWDDVLDDPENLNGEYDPNSDDIRYGPGFTEEERSHTQILVNNDYDFGQGLSLFRNQNKDYAVYPLRSGAFIVRVHNDGDATYAYKFRDEQQFIEHHGPTVISDPREQAELFRFVVSQGGGTWKPPADHVSWYGEVLTPDEGRPRSDDDEHDPSP